MSPLVAGETELLVHVISHSDMHPPNELLIKKPVR